MSVADHPTLTGSAVGRPDLTSPTDELQAVRPRARRSPRSGSASDRGLRGVAADALAVRTAGAGLALAVADGIGDSKAAARAARVAADVATLEAVRLGPTGAILAARDAVLTDRGPAGTGDCVLVLAAGGAAGWRISWVGDSRAYAWDGEQLVQLTTDHTVAEYLRGRGEDAPARTENVVTTTVATARGERIGQTLLRAGARRLALLSDGVHRTLTANEIAAVLATVEHPAAAARALVDDALLAGSTDNATATVVDLP
ncbi:MAG: serine/threonine protein phosphatase [Pseudonocardia sp.]|nr:serine/threonine protein phosphatase [Pseudonocardia sp.]